MLPLNPGSAQHRRTSLKVRISTRTLLSFFAVTFCGFSQDQWWPLRFRQMGDDVKRQASGDDTAAAACRHNKLDTSVNRL